MKTWQDLPTEVLDNIFQNLEQNEIERCSLTCRVWRSVALPILFEKVEIPNGDNLCKLVKALLTATIRDINYQSPGNFVKTLKFSFYKSEIDIALLNQAFPFLQYISYDGGNCLHRNELYRFLMEGKFPNLRKTPFTSLDRAHLKLMLARKENIKKLELRNPRFDVLMDELYEILPLLHRLEFFKMEFSDYDISLETLLSKAPSTLKSMDFEFRVSSKITFNSLHSSNIQPLLAVRELKISDPQLHILREEDYLYIMKKFPRVELLEFEFDWQHLKALDIVDYTIPTRESILAFLLYLFNIKRSSSVPATITNLSTAAVIGAFFNHILSKKLYGTYYENLEIHLKLNFKAIEAQPGHADDENFTACIIPKNKFFKKSKICKVEVGYKTILGSTLQPYLKLFQNIGNMDIECLTIGEEDWVDNLEENVHIPLGTILNHFNNLKKLIICGSSNLTLNEEPSSLEEKPKSILKCLEFHFCDLGQNLFSRISTLCPDLKVLKIDVCRFSYAPSAIGSPNISRHIQINMPNTRLDELHFSISLDILTNYYPHKTSVIKVETTKGKPEFYRISSKSTYDSDDEFLHEIISHPYTEANFEKCLRDEDCLVYYIYCESITKLFVNTETYDSYKSVSF